MSQELDLANKWLDFTIESFVENMRKLRIQDTGTLMASFKKQVIGSAEGRLQLQLSYALYGKFIDMGVGRGMGQGVGAALQLHVAAPAVLGATRQLGR